MNVFEDGIKKKKALVLLVRTEAGTNVLSSAGRADNKPERQQVDSVFPDPARWLFLKWVKKTTMKQPLKHLSKKKIYSSSPSERLQRLQNQKPKKKGTKRFVF